MHMHLIAHTSTRTHTQIIASSLQSLASSPSTTVWVHWYNDIWVRDFCVCVCARMCAHAVCAWRGNEETVTERQQYEALHQITFISGVKKKKSKMSYVRICWLLCHPNC